MVDGSTVIRDVPSGPLHLSNMMNGDGGEWSLGRRQVRAVVKW